MILIYVQVIVENIAHFQLIYLQEQVVLLFVSIIFIRTIIFPAKRY